MDLTRLTVLNNYKTGDVELVNPVYKSLGSDTKKTLKKMIPLSGDEITSKCEDGISYVTRKMNGELCVIVYEKGECIIVNSNDVAKASLPVLEELATKISSVNIEKAIFIGELYSVINGLDRVSYVSNALSTDTSKLNIAVFDILEVNGARPIGDYGVIHGELERIFSDSGLAHAVWMKKGSNKQAIVETFNALCINGNAEGLVVRASSSITYKIKQKYTLDCVIVGYTSDDDNSIRNLLLAVMDENNSYQVIAKVGVGLNNEQSINLYKILSESTCESSYIDADGKKLAFRFVKPQIVIEISATDISNENLEGIISNPLLTFDNRYNLASFVSGISLTHAIFERVRDDKKATKEDASISQISDYIISKDEVISFELQESSLLVRDVYIKKNKDKTSLQKFMVYETNKSETKKFLKYMFYYTDFSEGRKDPLKTEIRISDSKDQIFKIYELYKTENLKKGWELVC
jgi:hypothetical protein